MLLTTCPPHLPLGGLGGVPVFEVSIKQMAALNYQMIVCIVHSLSERVDGCLEFLSGLQLPGKEDGESLSEDQSHPSLPPWTLGCAGAIHVSRSRHRGGVVVTRACLCISPPPPIDEYVMRDRCADYKNDSDECIRW